MRIPQLFYKIAYGIFSIYWFVFRPHIYGAKVVIERDGKVLLVRHSYGPRQWSFPGGGQKKGEALEKTAIREVEEETGVRLGGVSFIGSFISENEYKHDHVHVFLGHSDEGEVSIDHSEIVAHEWATHESQRSWTPIGERIWSMYLAHKRSAV